MLRVENRKFFDLSIGTITLFAGTRELTKKEKDDETAVPFAKAYIVFVGTLAEWKEQDSDLLFYFKSHGGLMKLSSKKYQGGRIYGTLYDAARFTPIPDHAWEQLYRQLRPYRVPFWHRRLEADVLCLQFAIPNIKLELADASAYSMQEDPPIELTLL